MQYYKKILNVNVVKRSYGNDVCDFTTVFITMFCSGEDKHQPLVSKHHRSHSRKTTFILSQYFDIES